MYADDLVLISESREGLQRQIDTLEKFCTKWKLKINVKKTKSMVFNRGNKIIKSEFKVEAPQLKTLKPLRTWALPYQLKIVIFKPLSMI